MALFNRKNRQPTNEEQMSVRQSAPMQTVDEALAMSQPMYNPESIDAFRALKAPIGKEAVQKATQTLNKYKSGKTNLEQRIIDNEKWYKLRHWDSIEAKNTVNKSKSKGDVKPSSAWLFNCIANKHADAMDNFPSPNVLPREAGDKEEAKILGSILPVILEENDFEKTYSDVWYYKLKSGTGCYGVFWDKDKLNGLGDISIRKCDLLNLFWEPGVTDIQESRNLFYVELVDNSTLKSMYPQLADKLGNATVDVATYAYDDNVDTTDKSVVVDWYYKKNFGGKTVLHFCKYVNDVVLFATENEQDFAERGLYDHGKYPFFFDPLFGVEGSPAGFGYIDVGKSAQEYIDRGNQAIMQNMLSNCKPRYFIRSDGSVNEEEYADMTKDFIHTNDNLGEDSIMPVNGKPLSDIYVSVIANKVDELKETTGNRDIATGGTTSGVTAASAIAAMQEAGSKLSRDANKASYRVFREICTICIELIRQFYDTPRFFRIIGQNGAEEYIRYTNERIVAQQQGIDFGVDLGVRIPVFDVEVSAQKQSPYSKMAQNELALQFFQLGFFNPQMADQALACLEMMDFDRKDFIVQRISQNGGMLQQIMALAQMVDQAYGGNVMTMAMSQQYGVPISNEGETDNNQSADALGGDSFAETEAPTTKKARQRVAEATSPT